MEYFYENNSGPRIMIADNHIAITSATDVFEICHPLFSHTEITYFEFCRYFPDGSRAWLATDGKRTKQVFDDEIADAGDYTSQVSLCSQRYYLWFDLLNMLLNQAHKACESKILIARNDFQIDHGLSIVEDYQTHQDYFSFAAKPSSHSITLFYLNNLDFLENFIFYFKEKATKLIRKSVEQKIVLPRINSMEYNLRKSECLSSENNMSLFPVKKYVVKQDSHTSYITRQEYQSIKLLARGKTIKEISLALELSSRTVEYYLKSARDRLNVFNNAALIRLFWDTPLSKLPC
jgi:DNA-binding CsgD family transcriptional regulator